MRNVYYDIRVHLKRSKRFSMKYDIILSPVCPPPDETSPGLFTSLFALPSGLLRRRISHESSRYLFRSVSPCSEHSREPTSSQARNDFSAPQAREKGAMNRYRGDLMPRCSRREVADTSQAPEIPDLPEYAGQVYDILGGRNNYRFRGISMEEKTANASVQTGHPATDTTPAEQSTAVGSTAPAAEARQALGSAKTENLRDSGLWRILLPVVVVLFCLALLAIPLMFLVPLLFESFNPAGPTGASGAQLTWVWVVMIVLEVTIAAMIIRGLVRVFMTQAGNYHA
jgi:hypothetical protein